MEISGSITESNDLDENVEATSLPAKSIKAIDKTAVHKICSGQVVLTLATAVKELVENSIDAGSSSIEIRLKDHGSTLIEVLDNGKGVEACDFEGLTLKHHTSKLQDFGDLVGVKTFGFRGEALSSLCALSTLTVTTRHHSQSVGTRLVYDVKGNLLQQTPVSRQVGTTVTLQDLFHTLPVRHKEFLRNIKKEFTKMVHVLYSYCLIATNVRISCTNQVGKNSKTTVVSTESHCSLKENISSIFGHKQVTNLLEIVQRKPSEELLTDYGMTSIADTESFTIEGFVSSCDHGKGRCSADRQFYFINNRPCDPAKITRLVNEVYHHYNKHQYPMVVMNIRMKEDDVDINVTPDKRQIMVNKEKFLLATVKATLVGLYENIPSNYTIQQTPLFRQITNQSPSSVQSPSSKRVSSLLERFSRSPASPSSLPQNGSGKSPVSTSFANLKRSLTSQSQFESSPKQQKLQDFSFESNVLTNSPNNKKENQCNTEVCLQGDIKEASPSAPSQHVHSDDNTSEEKENIGHQLVSNCSVSNGNVIDKNIRNLSVFSASKSPDVKSSSPLNSHRSKIHSKTDDFLKNLKARSFSVNKSSKLSSDSKNSPNESKATGTSIKSSETDEQNDILYLGSNQVTDSELVQSPSVFTYDDLPESGHKFACHKSKVKKSVTIPFEIGNIRKSLLSKAKNSEKEEAMFRKFRATISPTDNQAAEEELKKEIHKESFRNMNIIGQFNLGFIIARLQSDLFIIDQHATDEKYNFETLQKTCVLQNQKLIIPQTLELTPANEMILIDNLDIFKRNGFVFKIDESKPVGSRVLLTSIPHSKGWEFNKDDIEEMIFLLSDSPGVMCRPSRVNAMFASRACRKSIMIGTALGHAQMRKLLNHMSEIEQPWNCPHGRPTLRHIINLDMLSKNK